MIICFKVAGFTACLAAVLAMTGGHWLTLQSVAWGRMIADFSRQDSLGTAISKTFSGKYPCALCLKVRRGWQQDKQREERAPWIRTDRMPEPFWEPASVTLPAAPTVVLYERAFVPGHSSVFVDSPPTPPPRACFGAL